MDQRWAELARTLRALGLWQHLPADEAEAGERAVAEGAHPLGGKATLDEEPGLRLCYVDGETMAEGGVARVLAEWAPALRRHGVDPHIELVSYPDSVEDGDYVITINGRRCVVWTPQDWVANSPWAVATVRPLAVINDLLAEAGAVPRVYTLYAGGNDAEAWLLDPRIVAAIAESGLIREGAVPALAAHA
ncbi:hypothetical protein GCM10020358_45290 [Amorphoplanes nipponensis]|uniref:Uncharacterized protein n=1 Tax=Actinoplanes nipponensis TaxID=135950 RepID=A0A919JQQ6_9ACTN|nr:hypothetical protein [Actinoplanes nipponensis]GIE53595.1 hypothetical protein Ani05nite_71290 [Actinoplanes nipponensis]